MAEIDFGNHSRDYANDRPGFPASFYDRLDSLAPLNGSRVLDLATGPGTIALELAARGSTVLGLDISANLIREAERLATKRGLSESARFRVAPAENTEERPCTFDLVTAGQCWHWFDSEAAAAESRRVLRPGGALVIAYYSYLAPYSPPAHDTEDLILKFNPGWTMAGSDGIIPELIDHVIRGGFEFVEAFCHDRDELFTHERWRARMRTCNGVGSGGMSPDEVDRFDIALAALLKRKYPEPVSIAHRVWCVVALKPV